MAIRHNGLAVLALVALITTGAAAETHSSEEIAAQRQEILDSFLAPDGADVAARERQLCFLGKQPQRVRDDRARGAYFSPDAADACVVVLTRLGRDQQLLEQYRKFVLAIGGDVATVASLPQTIGAAVMNGQHTVALGNGKGANVRPSTAFDAGFTVAYQERGTAPAGASDQTKLKAVTETCLDDQQDAGTCFSVGYLQGARAYRQ
jgi:hypothetical protein